MQRCLLVRRSAMPSAAQEKVLNHLLCAVFPRYAWKNRTQLKGEYRSAEGSARQLRKSYQYSDLD